MYQATTGPHRTLTMTERIGYLTDEEELNTIAHYRSWCHDSTKCPPCQTEAGLRIFWTREGRKQALNEIAEG